MNTFNTLAMATMAMFFLGLAFYATQKAARLKADNAVLWDQVERYDAYVRERAAEDELKQRAAIRN